MNRRRFLELAPLGVATLAGCSEQTTRPTRSPSATPSPTLTATETSSATESPTATDTDTETPRENPNTIFVGPDGEASNDGTRTSPLASVNSALLRAEPGETVYLLPGRYREHVETVRAGNPGEPITLEGPPEAALHGASPDRSHTIRVRHSHIHLRGFTLTGLHDPARPTELASYIENSPVRIYPPFEPEAYLTDIVIKPSRLGYSRQQLIGLDRTKQAEVGEFRVIGPAGARYHLTERSGHNGEIVYVGTAPDNLGASFHPWEGYDRTSHVHIHHIDNSAGHPHSEIVNAKLGTHDVTVEYCTDAGGSKNTEDYPAASVRLQSYGATVRWNDLSGGQGSGITIGSSIARDAQEEEPPSELTKAERLGGTRNEIYHNRVMGFDGLAFALPLRTEGQSAEDQAIFCGNSYNGPTDGDPDAPCPESVPTGDGTGHLAGDSPWA